jgi:hypothetical protein
MSLLFLQEPQLSTAIGDALISHFGILEEKSHV